MFSCKNNEAYLHALESMRRQTHTHKSHTPAMPAHVRRTIRASKMPTTHLQGDELKARYATSALLDWPASHEVQHHGHALALRRVCTCMCVRVRACACACVRSFV